MESSESSRRMRCRTTSLSGFPLPRLTDNADCTEHPFTVDLTPRIFRWCRTASITAHSLVVLRHVHSSLRSKRLAGMLVAVIALSQSLGVYNAFACSLNHDTTGDQSQMAMGHEMMPGEAPMPSGTECDSTPHRTCPSSSDGSCAMMSGCATPAFALAERAILASSISPRALVPVTLEHELQRSTAPEPPPPRA